MHQAIKPSACLRTPHKVHWPPSPSAMQMRLIWSNLELRTANSPQTGLFGRSVIAVHCACAGRKRSAACASFHLALLRCITTPERKLLFCHRLHRELISVTLEAEQLTNHQWGQQHLIATLIQYDNCWAHVNLLVWFHIERSGEKKINKPWTMRGPISCPDIETNGRLEQLSVNFLALGRPICLF